MSSLIGALRVTLGLDSAAFEKGASAAEKRARGMQRSLEDTGKSMQNLGAKMSVAVTLPLVALGKSSVEAALQSKDALAQVENTIKTMGNAAGRTAGQLQALAGGIQDKSLYDDDDVLRKVTNTLLTFGNVSGNVFDQAQQAAVDLSAKLGGDLQASAILVGKALNDPVKGLKALTRVGVSFTDQQKEQIKTMAEAGNAAGAQKVILAELAREFGGAAETARKADPFAEMNKQFRDFQEGVGAQLLKILPNVTNAISGLLNAFNKLPDGVQEGVVIVGVLAAAFGPLLAVLGTVVSATAPFLGAIGTIAGEGGVMAAASAAITGLGITLGPILIPLAAIAAAGALIYANWDSIAPVLAKAGDAISAALGPATQALITSLSTLLSDLWNGPLGSLIGGAVTRIINLQAALVGAFGAPLLVMLKSGIQGLADFFTMIDTSAKQISAFFNGGWRDAFNNAAQSVNRMVDGIQQAVVGRLGAIWDTVKAKVDAVKGYFFGLYDAVVGHSYVPDMVDGIAAEMLRLDSVMVDQAGKATQSTKAAFQALAQEVRPILDSLFPDAAALADYQHKLDTIAAAAKAGVIDQGTANQATNRLILDHNGVNPLGDPINVIPITDQLDVFKDKVKSTTEAAKGNFAEMAQNITGSLQQLAGSIRGGGFLDILSSVLGLVTQLGGAGLFGSKIAASINAPKTPAFANGTNFAPGGLALVGERGPELVNLPRGSQVFPNGKGPGGGGSTNHYHINGNLLTPEFWGQIQAMDAASAQTGSQMAQTSLAKRQYRRVS